jgi:hypothetical protein
MRSVRDTTRHTHHQANSLHQKSTHPDHHHHHGLTCWPCTQEARPRVASIPWSLFYLRESWLHKIF